MKSTSPSEADDGEERSAGFVLFCGRYGRRVYLLLRHRDGGHWAFPKGRIEPKEDDLSAARREIAEETGIRGVRPLKGFRGRSAYRFVRGGRTVSKTVVYFLAEVGAQDGRLSDEHTDAAWLEADEARRRLTYEETRRILDEAETYLAVATPGARAPAG